MISHQKVEFLERKATAIWLWLTSFCAYTISIVLPIIGSNVEKWLKPLLIKFGAPDFIQADFTVYGTVFGICGVLTTKAVKRLVIIDASYKDENAEKYRALKKEHKSLKADHKKISEQLENRDAEHEVKTQEVIAKCEDVKSAEIKTLKDKHKDDLERVIDDYEREARRLRECLKLQDVALDAMKNYKAVEQNYKEYNTSDVRRQKYIKE
ncbi:TPA: hypothetical protein QCH81_002224 [Enterobacter bugandensis]|nr:hypothetical protein [Enterobacter bugandensis]